MSASGSDGSIRIDTALDNTGFKKGSDELKRAVKSLADEVRASGKDVSGAFDLGEAGRTAETFSQTLKQISDDLAEIKKMMQRTMQGSTESMQEFAGQSNKAADNLQTMREELQEIENTTPPEMPAPTPASTPAGTGNIGKAAEVKKLSGIVKIMRRMMKDITTAFKVGAVTSLAGVTAGFGAAAVAAARFVYSVKQIGSGLVMKGLGKMAGGIKVLGAGMLSFAKNAAGKAIEFIKSSVTEGFGVLAQQNSQLAQTMSDFKTALSGLRLNIAAAFAPIAETVLPILTAFINKLSEAAQYVNQFFSALTGRSSFQKVIPAQESVVDTSQDATQAMGDETDAAKDLKKELMGFDDVNILHGPDNDKGNKLDQGTLTPAKKQPTLQTMPIDNKMPDMLKKLKEMWANADFTALGRQLGEKLRDSLNNIPWDGIKENLRKIAKSIATFLNGFLETPGLFEAIGRTMAEGLNSAFEFLNSFAQNFHFASLGAAIGKALTTAMNTIDWPLIYDTFRNWGTGLANAINGFLHNTDFTLIGETLANALNAIYTGVYNFVSTLEWDTIGTSIKDAILGLANKIDWNTIYETYKALGRGIGTALQNAVNDPAIWTALFTIISNGLNTALILLNEFIMSINWADFGTNIGMGLNNGVSAFNWDLLSDTLINLINAAFDMWYNFVTTFDYNKFGTHIGQTVSDVLNNVNWVEGGMAVGATVSGLLDALSGFVNTTDWGSLGQAVVDVIGGFFGAFQWSTLGELLSGCLSGLLDFLTGAIVEIDWLQVPTYIVNAIGDFLKGADWSEIASSTMELLGAALGAAIQLVGGFALAVWNWIKDGISHIGDYFDNSIDECGGNIALGILTGIGNGLANIATWIVDNVFKPFVEGLKSAFGISSPASTMLPFGAYVVLGFLNGIKEAFKSIFTFLKENVFDPFVSNFKTLFGLDGEGGSSSFLEFGGQIIAGLLKGITDGVTGIAEWLKVNVFDPFVSGFKTLFGLGEEGGSSIFLDFGGSIVSGLLKGITDGVSGIAGWLETNLFTPIVSGVKTLFGFGDEGGSSVFLEFGGWLIDGLKNGLTGAVDGIGTWIETNVTGPIKGFFESLFGIGSPSTIFEGYGGWLIEGLKEGLLAAVSGIGTWIDENVTGPVLGFFKDFFGIGSPSTVFNEYGGWLMEGLEDGITENKGIVETAMNEVGNSVKTEWDTAADNVKKTTDSMNRNSKTSFEDMQKSATSNTKTARQDVTDNYGESDRSVQRSMASMNSQTREGMHYISTTINAYSDAQKKKITETWMEVALNLGAKLSGINTAMTRHFQDMVRIVGDATREIDYRFREAARGAEAIPTEFAKAVPAFQSTASELVRTTQNMVDEIRGKFNSDWGSLGRAICDGISAGIRWGQDGPPYAVGMMMQDAFNRSHMDWHSIGREVCEGIYNGIHWGWGWLTTEAWNLAVDMLNNARRALGIASPSKEFHWVAEMMTAGLVNGIEDTKDRAIGAVGDVASDLVHTAEETSPIIPISAEAGGLTNEFEHVLDAFTNKVTSSFSAMIESMERIVGGSSFMVPAVATGTRVPYSVSAAAATQHRSSDTDAVLQMLAAQNRDVLTRQDLVDILTRLAPLFRSDFYLDGENLARHVNEGNRRLNRRYSATER